MHLSSRLSIAAFTCALSDLVALAKATGQPESIFHLTDPVILSVTVEFSGSGAIALLPLAPSIQVDFFAQSFHPPRKDLELGTVTLPTVPMQLLYTPAVSLSSGLDAVGAVANQAYVVSALVRIGANGFPALITGMIDGLILQTYN